MLKDIKAKEPTKSSKEHSRLLAERLRYQIATREPFIVEEASDAQICTLWGAKGITAHHVYLLGLCNEAIPGTRRDEYPGTDSAYFEEQRRLFYVSLTRSKKTLMLSRALKIKPGEASDIGLGPVTGWFWMDLHMSRFLQDIISLLPEYDTGEEWVKDYTK